ncbi:MAG: hypothetical protein RL037_2132 [Bacteroidota bacterium]|jgi:putative alpha-1,2-mannosidase
MQAKMADGSFKTDFNPLATHDQGFIEGNSWNFSFFVPHNPMELVEKMVLNGKPLLRYFINYDEIINGGELIFILGDKPKKNAN